MTDCPFCGIVADSSTALTTIRRVMGGVWIIDPLNPVVPGHVIAFPEPHITDAADDPALAGRAFEEAAWWARFEGVDFNLITSKGPAATQTVGHLHIHYVPRRPGDGLALPWGWAP